jgi:cell division protein FtsW (lipid II flippase)
MDFALRRSREAFGIAAAGGVVLAGIALLHSVKSSQIASIENSISTRQVVDLRRATPGEMLPTLKAVFPDPDARLFVALRITEYPRNHPLPNVGGLANILVRPSEVESVSGLESIKERISRRQERERNASIQPDSPISLLAPADIAHLKSEFVVRRSAEYWRALCLWTGLYFAAFWLVHVVWRILSFEGDEVILPILQLLTGIGLICMMSLRDPLRDTLMFSEFSRGVIAGCILLLLCSFLDFERVFGKLTFLPLLLSFALSLALVLFGHGPGLSDAKVNLGPFQPGEFIKILLVFFLAAYLARNWEYLRHLKEKRTSLQFLTRWVRIPHLDYYLPIIICAFAARLLFVWQKDLGPALIFSVCFATLYGIACNRARMVVFSLGAIALGLWSAYHYGVQETVRGRVAMWISPWSNAVHGGDQLAQSLWAMSAGGILGSGLGKGTPGVIPAGHTDLILAVVGEQLGFMGMLLVLGLMGILGWRAIRAAKRARTDYGYFLAIGLTGILFLEFALIASGILGLFPLTGVVTPFLSYGRTAMLANFFIFAVLISLSRQKSRIDRLQPFQSGTRWLATGLAAVLAIITAKVAYVQVLRANDIVCRGSHVLQADGVRRYQYNPRFLMIAAQIRRGSIYDRGGIPLATNNWAEAEQQRSQLQSLGIDLDKSCTRPEGRCYPYQGTMFYLLGDLRTHRQWTATNTAFVERDSNVRLQGFDDHAKVEKVEDPLSGQEIRAVTYDYHELIPRLRHHSGGTLADTDPRRDVTLTISAQLQVIVTEILTKHLLRSGNRRGAVVVVDSASGDVLASVSLPLAPWGSDAQGVGDDDADDTLDRARFGLYPPGSVFKLVTAMTALKTDPALADQPYACRRLPDGRIGNYVPGWKRPIRDDMADKAPHGTLTMGNAMALSCNAYFAQLAGEHISPQNLIDMAGAFGISVARPNNAVQLHDYLPQAAYGQGQVLVSPLRIAMLASAIGNEGKLPSERWLSGDPTQYRDVIDPQVAAKLADWMRLVVTDGTGIILRENPIPIAGKTGTAEIADAPSHAWFVGIAPYRPAGKRIAFAVVVENGRYGGSTAAAIAGDVVSAARNLGFAGP